MRSLSILSVAAACAASAFVLGAMPARAGPSLLIEPATGTVLFADEPDRLWHPASVTKLMTAYVVFEAVAAGRLAWDADVPLSEHARRQPATRIGLRAGIKLNVEQAVRGLILRSANDFATALAERVSGSEPAFVAAMNETARRLGMAATVFRNPHGLPDAEQVTTARDLARLAMAVGKDFPDRAEVFATPTVRIHKGTFHSQNDLLRTLDGADGMKTGFTCASGYNVVASASRNGQKLVAIVLGAVNRQKRSERAAELIEAGFAHLQARASGPVARSADTTAIVTASIGGSSRTQAPAVRPTFTFELHPVPLASLSPSPSEAHLADDMARRVKSGKCRGYAGFQKPETTPVSSEDEDAAPVAVTPVAGANTAATTPPAAAPAPSRKVTSPKPVPPRKAAARTDAKIAGPSRFSKATPAPADTAATAPR